MKSLRRLLTTLQSLYLHSTSHKLAPSCCRNLLSIHMLTIHVQLLPVSRVFCVALLLYLCIYNDDCMAWWCNGPAIVLVTERSWVLSLSGNNLSQVVHTHVPPFTKGSDDLHLCRCFPTLVAVTYFNPMFGASTIRLLYSTCCPGLGDSQHCYTVTVSCCCCRCQNYTDRSHW